METPTRQFSGINSSPEFAKDFKKLTRKFPSLKEDLKTFKNTALKAFHHLGQENVGIFQIPNLGFHDPKVYKATKFACKSLKGRGAATGIRVVYAYYPEKDEILLIEMYIKADRENEDRERIVRCIKNYSNPSHPRVFVA